MVFVEKTPILRASKLKTVKKGAQHKGGVKRCPKCGCIHWKDDGVCPMCGEVTYQGTE